MTVIDDIRSSPMSRYQIRSIALCLALMFMDGYDVAVMAFAAPGLSAEWDIGSVMLGYLLSASLFGMAAGSILLTPLADRIGRRPLTILSVGLIALGMAGSVLSVDVGQLLATRVLTGIGIGGMVANVSVLVAELSSDRRRGLAMGLYVAGFPIGATLCGLVAGPLIPMFGWRSIFLIGAVFTLVMLVLSLRALPESIESLLSRRPQGALERVNALLTKLGQPVLTGLPPSAAKVGPAALREVLAGWAALRTVLLWLGFALLSGGFYFATSWTPKIIAMVTGDPGLGVSLGTVANLGGIAGAMGFGALTGIVGVWRLAVGALSASAMSFLVFALIIDVSGLAFLVVFLLGALIAAGVAGYYTLGTQVYSARARATGMGWMLGVGRLMSITAPVLVGYLLAAEVPPSALFAMFAGPLLVSALCIAGVGALLRANRGTPRSTADLAAEQRSGAEPGVAPAL
jgi:benzoate transport